MRDLLPQQPSTEEGFQPSNGRLDNAWRNAKDLGQSNVSIIRGDSQAGERFNATLVRVYLRAIANHQRF